MVYKSAGKIISLLKGNEIGHKEKLPSLFNFLISSNDLETQLDPSNKILIFIK